MAFNAKVSERKFTSKGLLVKVTWTEKTSDGKSEVAKEGLSLLKGEQIKLMTNCGVNPPAVGQTVLCNWSINPATGQTSTEWVEFSL